MVGLVVFPPTSNPTRWQVWHCPSMVTAAGAVLALDSPPLNEFTRISVTADRNRTAWAVQFWMSMSLMLTWAGTPAPDPPSIAMPPPLELPPDAPRMPRMRPCVAPVGVAWMQLPVFDAK